MTAFQAALIETITEGLIEVRRFVRHFPADRVDWDPMANG